MLPKPGRMRRRRTNNDGLVTLLLVLLLLDAAKGGEDLEDVCKVDCADWRRSDVRPLILLSSPAATVPCKCRGGRGGVAASTLEAAATAMGQSQPPR